MRTGIICCREQGRSLGQKLSHLVTEGEEPDFYGAGFSEGTGSMDQWVREKFHRLDAMIFVGDCDTVLQVCGALVESKKTDPAVLVVDEQGKFVISLMSGHIGGANELAEKIAGCLGAIPVVTTATDLNRKFAVDVFATKNHCRISSMVLAKEISAALVNGDQVGFYSDLPWEGKIPEEVVLFSEEKQLPKTGFCVTLDEKKQPFEQNLYLTPKILTIGIGCRKGTPEAVVEKVVHQVCDREKISLDAVEQAASIDLKKEEPGLLAFCKKYGLPFVTFTKEELLQLPGSFSGSDFVKKITGVDNVCERSALLACSHLGEGSRLIIKKYAHEGVTVAFAVRKWSVRFE